MTTTRFQWDGMREQAAKTFAERNGWRISERGFVLPLLVSGKMHCGGNYYDNYRKGGRHFDHPEYFKRDRRPVCILAHNYENVANDLREFIAGRDDLVLHIPPAGKAASWYFPGHTMPMAVTRPDVGAIVWPTADEMFAWDLAYWEMRSAAQRARHAQDSEVR